ncbi:hypothetical protein B7R54_00715 [Subtercola boreus]|uniref:Gram-positive cocci surface proteins LPxTG domain-containing protein n=1 Tax=Subtercola boreus TaxID=120213 RepID=A0A3E0VGA2_9MICO|nr:putative Ig domain-containing protein [Subtercola boreus]RFA07897.1 hypothetical protein B7R54_00715 [Subtercola boreus]TQL55245.1 streptogramin lyase [Subtercola boreus]
MNRIPLIAVPALCALLLVGGASASAVTGTPVVTDPLVTLAGSAPTAVVPAANGGFFALNSGLDSVIEYNAAGQQVGAKATALLPVGSKSSAMVSDLFGSLYVANPGGAKPSVSRVDIKTGAITPFSLPAADVPVSLAISSTRDVFVTKKNDEVTRITPADVVTLAFAKLPAGSDPRGVVTDAAGNVYTANHGSNTISKITPMGDVSVYATLGAGAGPTGLAITPKGILWVSDEVSDTVLSFDTSKPANTPPLGTFNLPPAAHPVALRVDEFDNLFVADSGTNAISVIVPGNPKPQPVTGVSSSPVALAISSDNKLLVASKDGNAISSISLETKIGTSTIGPLTVGTAFAGTATATGVGDITFSSPDLPAWLKLDPSTGALTGTPTASGASSFTLRALSSVGRSDARTVTFDVAAAVVTPTPTPTPAPTTGGGTGGQGAGTGSGSGSSGPGSAGSGGHGTGSLASTGADDVAPWGLAGSVLTFLGLGALVLSSRRRARSEA